MATKHLKHNLPTPGLCIAAGFGSSASIDSHAVATSSNGSLISNGSSSTVTGTTTKPAKKGWPPMRQQIKMTQDEIDKVRKVVYDNNQYEFVETQVRNVLLCGRSRSGKSTAIGVLKDPCFTPKANNIFADTTDAKFSSFALNDQANEVVQEFTLNIVDTPGLFEVTRKGEEARTDAVIVETITKCLEHEVTYMNVVVMFATMDAGINIQDVEAMKQFLSMFGDSNVRMALCITRADMHSVAWRDDLRQQLAEHEVLSELISKHKMHVLFMGCTDSNSDNFDDADRLLQSYYNTYELREELIRFIFGATERAPLREMKVAAIKMAQVADALQESISNMRYFLTVKDFDVQRYRETLISHKASMACLTQNRGFLRDEEFDGMFADLNLLARDVKKSTLISEEDKTTIIGLIQV